MFERQIGPQTVMLKFGKMASYYACQKYIEKKFDLNNDERLKTSLTNFMFQLSQYECSTEKALFKLFEPPLVPHVPIVEKLRDLPVSFVFGEYDWVVSTGAEVLVTAAQNGLNENNCNLYTLKGAEHQP